MVKQSEKLGIQSVEVAAHILEALTRLGRAVPLRELAHEAEMVPAKVHRYLVSLVRTNLVAQDPLSGHYLIGHQSILMGLIGLRSLDVVRIVGSALPELRDSTGETAILAIWTENGPIVVQFDESDRPVYLNVRVGSILPLIDTSVGFVFAAHMKPEVLQKMIENNPIHRISKSKLPDYRATLEKVKKDGYAFVHGGLVSGVSAAAAPVFDHYGNVPAVIGVVGRQEDIEKKMPKKVVPALTKLASQLSERLGATAF